MTALIMPRTVRRAASSVGRAATIAGHPATAEHDAVAATAAESGSSSLRLTRRGRLFLIGLPFVTGAAALLVVAAVFLLPATVKASTDHVSEPVTHSVTVQAHQTLWDIAVAADPARDTREVMDDIAELNGLSSSVLSAGQVLEVPSR
ncbi:LysM peptidoglycan-binding domain-containing protein [Kocuria tytonis]|uniref:LysM peptidoglycan-binding domain-containing protein n=1 Tax=Kocuria tytonis TaxID=2054280 RepID=A0A495A1I3_9MICC|nr:LysM peptidoglycan-binding domain-containing protein [Kocuria tytonis]RKQ33330.1 LysM peptidoglycan-binding domain-containing protein [Kocuria tytonis]